MYKILNILLPLILLFFGVSWIRAYFGGNASEDKQRLEQLISKGQEAVGMLDSQYQEKTVKIRKIPVKTYLVGYTFKVGEQTFSGKKTLHNPPTEQIVKVKYMPSDPNNSAIDPEAELASLNSSEGSMGVLLGGIAALLAGIGLGYYRFRNYQRGA